MPHNLKNTLTEDLESILLKLLKDHFEDVKELNLSLKGRMEVRGEMIGGLADKIGLTITTPKERDAYRKRGCSICGYNVFEAIVIHHIDRSKDNNAILNLIPLCRNCHALVHRGLLVIDPMSVEIKEKEVKVEYRLNRSNLLKRQSQDPQQ